MSVVYRSCSDPVISIPASSATNKASPMPTIGVIRVSSCFLKRKKLEILFFSFLYSKVSSTKESNDLLEEHLPGAINVALLFSAANINTVKTSSAVKNISMKTPWAMDVPLVRVVVKAGSPGNMHRTRAAACTFPS